MRPPTDHDDAIDLRGSGGVQSGFVVVHDGGAAPFALAVTVNV